MTDKPIDKELDKATDAADTSVNADTAVEATAEVAAAPVKRKKNKRTVTTGHVHVLATFNNTIITVSDPQGAVLTTASAGGAGFRGSKKGTAYAAQVAAEKAIGLARQDFGLSKVDVSVKGIGLGREAAIRTLISQKVQVDNIRDITPVAHGGVRPRKAKRN